MVYVTREELANIKAIKNHTTERVMFVLLVLSKWSGSTELRVQKREILKYGKLRIDNDQLSRELYKLNQLGYIETLTNGARRINIISNDEISLSVEDIDNMIDVYLDTCIIEGCIFCEKCKRKIKKKCNSQKYCGKCAKNEYQIKHNIYVKNTRKNLL